MTYLNHKTTLPYDNYKMLNNNGEFMCFCDYKKANWYIKKSLAAWIDDKQFQLKFEPKGNGNKDLGNYYTTPIQNKCVVCGVESPLTKHHVVPLRIRSLMSDDIKSHASFDLVPICIACHEKYEKWADKFEKQLFKQFGIVWNQDTKHIHKKVGCKIHTLLHEGLPYTIKEKLIEEIREYFKKPGLEPWEMEEEYKKIDMVGFKDNRINQLVETVSHEELVIMWRRHFINTCEPKYMPVGWLEQIEVVKKLKGIP